MEDDEEWHGQGRAQGEGSAVLGVLEAQAGLATFRGSDAACLSIATYSIWMPYALVPHDAD